ncbi:hypothetical protein M8818_003316 [Zalaria obscura]|uniref:Uncharacterized protein n=1 Tax=Zalaria obscura TaxID=2024903 RepID=A0ACC3SET0_9PEZI
MPRLPQLFSRFTFSPRLPTTSFSHHLESYAFSVDLFLPLSSSPLSRLPCPGTMPQEPEPPWRATARRKRAQQEAAIPPEWRLKPNTRPAPDRTNILDVPRECGILTVEEIRITESYDACGLLEELRRGRLKAVDVARAFCKRAAVAQQLSNCLTELLFEPALSRAAVLDAHFSRTGQPIGPLHGLPVSVKDMFDIAGHDSSLGLAALCFRPATSTAALVAHMVSAGAVIIAKTNVPQTLMALDSHNNVFGRVLNPLTLRLSAGGSSGGEGVLVAMRGSALGVGTDVGGSIRVPAMCVGVVGVKPSHGRISYAGVEGGSRRGMEAVGIRASAGPIARSVRDCEMFLRTVVEGRLWERDPDVVPGGWAGMEALRMTEMDGRARKIRVGIVRSDGVTTPLPPIARLMDEVSSTLRTSQTPKIEVLDVSPDLIPLLSRAQSLANALFGIDGANTMADLLESTSEPLSPWLRSRFRRRPRPALDKVADLHARRRELQTQVLAVWTRYGLDALLAPVAPHPVPKIDRWNTAAYTSAFVLLDLPAASMPVRVFGEGDLEGAVQGEVKGSWDRYNRGLWEGEGVDRRVYLGSPLSVQVVGERLGERKLVEVMRVLEEVFARGRERGGGGEGGGGEGVAEVVRGKCIGEAPRSKL